MSDRGMLILICIMMVLAMVTGAMIHAGYSVSRNIVPCVEPGSGHEVMAPSEAKDPMIRMPF